MTTHIPKLQVQIRGKTNGEDLRPGVISSRKIADFMIAFEEAIASVILAESPQLKKEQIIVGLEGIHQGSIALSFSTNPQALVLPAMRKIAYAVQKNDFSGLTNPTRGNLQLLQNIVKQFDKGATVTFFEQNGSAKQLAVLTAESVIPKPQYIKGYTTLYGEVTRLGGKTPKIQITDFGGQSISCLASKELVLEVKERLYQTVAIKGIAKWDADTLEMLEFWAEELLPYREIPLTDFFAGMAEIVGNDFVEVDPDEFVYQLRYEM